ncbi:hypothetical protein [Guggenheimella bovis]
MRKLLLLLMILFLVGCQSNETKIAFDRTEAYIESMNERDIDTQLKLLEAFDLDKATYSNSFLRYVKEAKLLSMKVAYEDKYFLIIEVNFTLTLSDDFPEGKLRVGENALTRYITFYKHEDMQIREILDRLIK